MKKEQQMEDDSNLKLMEENILKYNKDANFELLEKAYYFAKEKHEGQKRKSGEPFFVHPVAVANMLVEMEMDMASVIAGLLHDILEDTETTYEELEENFGHEIAYLVDGVTKLKRLPTETKEEAQADNMRKMVISMAEDIRVIVIKLVDRLHNMRTLQYVNTDKQVSKAKETLEIYTPLAHRLGMTKIKWELEDLCFKYLDPVGYDDLMRQINRKREQQEAYIAKVLENIKQRTDEMNIQAFLDGRPKHLYSIRKKMISQGKSLDQIYDLIAVRVIVNTVKECYTVLGIVHELYTPMPGRVKDYIAMPKPNMYQSLHTTLIGPDGQPFEVQIRTWEMHKVAEIGIAAHWRYKEGGKNTELDGKVEWLRNIIENQKEIKDPGEFMENFKMDLFTDEVFVFTPKGEVKNLPAGSTPIDFAYSIHSAIGNRTIGAKVNGEIKQLNYKLKNGDIVEIITSAPPGRGPSRDWLNIVKSGEAKSKIRQWFKKERREENIEQGKEMIDREIKKTGHTSAELLRSEYLDEVLKRYNLHSADDMYNVVGFGDLSPFKVVTKLLEEYRKELPEEKIIPEELPKKDTKTRLEHAGESGIIVRGIDNCLVRLSHCCNPVPGDPIVGYVTKGRGVSVHRADCPNIISLEDAENRMIDVRWADKFKDTYLAQIIIKAADRNALLLDVANVIADENINMKAMNARKTKDDYAILDITIEIAERTELDRLIKRLRRVENVIEVARSVR